DALETAFKVAEDARRDARQRRETAARIEAEARTRLARAETAESMAAERHARATDTLAGLETATPQDARDPAVEAELRRARLDAARQERDRLAENAPDLEAAEAALERARAVSRGAEDEAQALRLELARLDTTIAQGAGDAVEEELADTRARAEAAQDALARLDFEVKVLQRLEAALTAASTEARERYFEPVAAELKPLLGLLWPDAELVWEDATLLPRALVRNGQEEEVGILSGGTQEQLALLVRLAFARMLAAQGRHAPVILDDALVFTDDDRIERMFDALHRQAGDLQIIVLSCRQRAFRDLGGRKLEFRPRAA
ncbi:MAG: ATP-binding protein, partial [Paracoccaceae bacterium]